MDKHTARRSARPARRVRRLPPLKDRLAPSLDVLFVGINPGIRSALTGHHFAGYSNRFWKLLYGARLVPRTVTYVDDDLLPGWGLGVTNLVPRPTRGVGDLRRDEYGRGRQALIDKITRTSPKVVALVGLTLARSLQQDSARRGREPVRLGLQAWQLASTPVFVLPNPSGRNAHYSYEDMLRAFRALRRYLFSRSSYPTASMLRRT